MVKSKIFTGQPIFTQLLQFIPRNIVQGIADQYQADRYCKKFYTYDHLVTMIYCCLHRCSSLREVITGMQVYGERLRHLGLKHTPRRSTLSESNSRRNHEVFQNIFHALINHYWKVLPDSRLKNDLNKLFIVDSTTVTLFSNIMKGPGNAKMNGKRKGGAKAHVLFDADRDIPHFVRITEARVPDSRFMTQLRLPPESLIVMDKGYKNYKVFAQWTQANIRWYTRLNNAAIYSIKDIYPVDQSMIKSGVKQDRKIILGNPRTAYINPIQEVRMVDYYDEESKKSFQFITNDFDSTALQIALIYKRRWQIELFFKRLKQNTSLKYFLGDNQNAIKIQIWCSLIADLLIKIILDKLTHARKKWSFANLSSLVRLHLGTYVDIMAFLLDPDKVLIRYKPPNHRWVQNTLKI